MYDLLAIIVNTIFSYQFYFNATRYIRLACTMLAVLFIIK